MELHTTHHCVTDAPETDRRVMLATIVATWAAKPSTGPPSPWRSDHRLGSSSCTFLANKADEDFSCYPSICTLVAESGGGRSTVMRAPKTLEATGFITRRPQFHDSGAQ